MIEYENCTNRMPFDWKLNKISNSLNSSENGNNTYAMADKHIIQYVTSDGKWFYIRMSVA